MNQETMTHEERNREMIRQMTEKLATFVVTEDHIVDLKKRLAEEDAAYQNQPRVSAQDFLNRTYSI